MESWLEWHESNSAELQAAADAEGELNYIRLSLRELVGETIPLQRWQEAAAQIPSVLEDKRSGLEALSLKRSLVETRCGLQWTHSAAQLADCMT